MRVPCKTEASPSDGFSHEFKPILCRHWTDCLSPNILICKREVEADPINDVLETFCDNGRQVENDCSVECPIEF